MRQVLNFCSNRKLACSDEAGIFLYGKNVYRTKGCLIPNAIDTSRFFYDSANRVLIRKEFQINADDCLIGHIGTIYSIKNQSFLVEIFAEYLKDNPNSFLMLVGEKFDTAPVINKATALNVLDRVILAGVRDDVYRFYSAFDIMIFPSLHEGLPLSLIEAQASKLPCIVSDSVSEIVKCNSNVEFVSLKKPPYMWSSLIKPLIDNKRNEIDIQSLLYNYDISVVIKKLEDLYV